MFLNSIKYKMDIEPINIIKTRTIYDVETQKVIEKFRSLLKNMMTNLDDQKDDHCWFVAGVDLCKDFFMFLHSVTWKQIERFQQSIRDDEIFKYQKKSNNKKSFELYEEMCIFMKKYFNLHVIPNPEGQGQHLLPSSFSIADMDNQMFSFQNILANLYVPLR